MVCPLFIPLFIPDEFVAFIDQHGSDKAPSEKVVKGYKVKVNYKAIDESEQKARREAIAKIIVQSMKRVEKK